MRAPLWPDKQMLYLAPMAKNCRFPAAAIVSVTAARGPRAREDKLPIQVRASSEEGKRGRRRNPIPLLSFPPFLFSLSCPHNVTSTFSLHSHVRKPPALRLPGGTERGRWAAYCDAFAHHIFRSTTRGRERREKGSGCRKTPSCRSGAGRGYLLLGHNTYTVVRTRDIDDCARYQT